MRLLLYLVVRGEELTLGLKALSRTADTLPHGASQPTPGIAVRYNGLGILLARPTR